MPNVQELAAPIKLLLMDVDGVLTDGKLINVPDAAGNMVETKAFDSQDGIALQWMSWKGIKTGLISGRNSPATVVRAQQCKFTYVYQGHIEKIPILEEILADAKIGGDEVAYTPGAAARYVDQAVGAHEVLHREAEQAEALFHCFVPDLAGAHRAEHLFHAVAVGVALP